VNTPILPATDERWMEYALKEAEQALRRKEVPIGAVIIQQNRIIGRGYNQTESLQDPTAHAEMIAITAAATHLGSRRLEDRSFSPASPVWCSERSTRRPERVVRSTTWFRIPVSITGSNWREVFAQNRAVKSLNNSS
jgi:pyrimidine deaminase RibD-like protein